MNDWIEWDCEGDVPPPDGDTEVEVELSDGHVSHGNAERYHWGTEAGEVMPAGNEKVEVLLRDHTFLKGLANRYSWGRLPSKYTDIVKYRTVAPPTKSTTKVTSLKNGDWVDDTCTWFHWLGGENPLPGERVEALLRDGSEACGLSDDFVWEPSAPSRRTKDIVRARLAPAEPLPDDMPSDNTSFKNGEVCHVEGDKVWFHWGGGAGCPIAHIVDVEVEFTDGSRSYDSSAGVNWRRVVKYRIYKSLPHKTYLSRSADPLKLDATERRFMANHPAWFVWQGDAEAPAGLSKDTEVRVRFRDGMNVKSAVSHLGWVHDPEHPSDDIVGWNYADSLADDIQEALTAQKQERYRDDRGGDWIDECARTFTTEEFRGAMRFVIGKYNRRMGKKDDVAAEVGKMADYCNRWLEYEKCKS